MKPLLWMLLAISLTTNIVVGLVDDGVFSIVVNAVTGILVLGSLAALITLRVRART
ncbi:hypothetical protein [Spirillospora sp. NPDC047279]|uniref:hypothetical protein n=1 Tax=Spirillospora sp. NPDC047279 TaxID=3155478 RepID=UPI0033C31B79